MSGDFVKPPTMGDGDSPIDMSLIYEATGVPPEYLTENFVLENVVPCVVTTFSDGEVVLRRPSPEDSDVREHFGMTDQGQSAFGNRLRELLEGDDIALKHQVDGLIRFSAGILARHVISGAVTLPRHRNVEFMPALLGSAEENDSIITSTMLGQAALRGWDMTRPAIGFDHHSVALDVEPSVVIDYGPGLQGRFHIERQLADLEAGRRPYAHLAVGKGPFINEFLQQYWRARLGEDSQLMRSVLGRVYVGREDGIAAATTEFVETQKQHTGSSEIADIVLASGVHRAGHTEIDAGITNAHKLLRPGGILLVRAPKAVDSDPSGVPGEAMVEMALQAGFDRDKARIFDIITKAQVGPAAQSLAAVFRK
ncbi:MAG TPA: hypothetical protein VLI54_00870 [Bacillota bacterium]|nr:hypothetical protein [Bacillota bacterium]